MYFEIDHKKVRNISEYGSHNTRLVTEAENIYYAKYRFLDPSGLPMNSAEFISISDTPPSLANEDFALPVEERAVDSASRAMEAERLGVRQEHVRGVISSGKGRVVLTGDYGGRPQIHFVEEDVSSVEAPFSLSTNTIWWPSRNLLIALQVSTDIPNQIVGFPDKIIVFNYKTESLLELSPLSDETINSYIVARQ